MPDCSVLFNTAKAAERWEKDRDMGEKENTRIDSPPTTCVAGRFVCALRSGFYIH